MFKMDSAFFRVVNKIFDVAAVSILWFVCSLPLFTAGAATTALYDTVLKNIRGNRGYCYKGFFHCFRENFRNTVVPSVIFVILTLISIGDVVILHNNIREVPEFAGMQFIFIGFWGMIMTWAIWTFALTARFENTWKVTMKNAAIMFFAHLPTTFIIIIIFGISAMLFWDIRFSVAFVPVGAMFLNSLLLEKVFAKYIEKEN